MRFSKLLLILLLCPFALQAAPAITVSGNSVTILGSAQTISLTCTLIDPNNTGNLRSGANIITTFITSTAVPSNVATCGPIYGNDVITDGYGNANTTYYKVQVFTVSNGIVASTPSLQQFYAFTGSGTIDLATATPLAPSFFTGPTGNVVMPGTLTVNGAATFNALISVSDMNGLPVLGGSTYACTGAGLAAAISAAGTLGVVDARACSGPASTASTIVVSQPMSILWGNWQLTGPNSGDTISVQNQGVIIKGTASVQNTNCSSGSAIISPTAAQAHGIHFTTTGNGNVNYYVSDISICDSTQGGTTRTSGDGVFADAAASPAQNSTGTVERVFVSYMFDGIVLNRPINTKVVRSVVTNSKSDGCVTQGDGTTVTWDTDYCRNSGGWDISQFGMATVKYITPAAGSGTGGGGIRIVRQGGTSGQQAVGTSISSPDVESEAGTGIYCLDCIGLTVTDTNILNNGGDGVHIDGGRGIFLTSGQVKGNTGLGLDVTQSATPVFPGSIFNVGLQLVSNTGGNEGGAAFTTAVTTLGYDGSAFERFNNPVLGPQFVASQGSPCTNGELSLSAGWQSTGSATVTAVAGNGQTCSWTITTGTTTAANPTVTDTLTNPLPAATTVCELNIHGGTHTAVLGEAFNQTTLSATAPVFTFNGTPTANGFTYFVTRRCGP